MIDELNSSYAYCDFPPVQTLRAFERAAALESFAAAANELNRTPSSISHAIRDLENRLGTRLFERKGRSIKLTGDGSEYLEVVRQALSILAVGTQRIRRKSLSKTVRISAPPLFSSIVLMPNFTQFEIQNPDLELLIETTNKYADIHNNEADIAIRFGDRGSQGLDLIALLQIIAQPICAPELVKNGLLSFADLAGHTLIHVAKPLAAWPSVLETMGVEIDDSVKHLSFDSNLGAIEAVKKGIGISLGLWPLIKKYEGYGSEFVPATEPCAAVSETYYIVCKKGANQQDKIQRTILWLKETVAALV